MMRQLRPHQIRALDLLKQSLLAGHRRPMLQAPTGFGKTLLTAAIVDGALRKGKRVLFVVPAIDLVDQTIASFAAEGIHAVGVMQGAHPGTDHTQPVQVASIQTLMRRKLPAADVVVIDEAHRWFEFTGSWMADPDWQRVPFIGLSATPWTKGLGKHYDDLIIAATTADLIESGYLAPLRVFAPSHPDLAGVSSVAGDYHEGELAEAMNKPSLVADVVDTWRKLGEGRSTLCFGVDRAHAKALQARFLEAGISAAYVDADTSRENREMIRVGFHDGTYKVVCNVGVLTMGVDWDVRCLILARPTRSEMLFTQIVGRGLRTAEGKTDCLILDHSDSTIRLGFVTDIHHETLDDGRNRAKAERKEREALPRECPACSYLKAPKVITCPSCGFKPERQNAITCDDGELVEISSRRSLGSLPAHVLLGQLIHYGRERDFKPGWAANQYRALTGHWPRSNSALPLPPSQELLSWLKSQQIRWAKRKGARHAAA